MAVYADRVKETTTTTGTGTYVLEGAVSGFQTFAAGTGGTNEVAYACEDGTDWEIGEGTFTPGSPATITRTTVLASSNAGAPLNWSAGVKSIFLTVPASRLSVIDRAETLSNKTLSTPRVSGKLLVQQGAPTSKSATATLTASELQSGIITWSGSAGTLTLPSGSVMDASWASVGTDYAFDCYFVHAGSTGTLSIAAGSGFTLAGPATVTTTSSGFFRLRRTGTNSWVAYRLG